MIPVNERNLLIGLGVVGLVYFFGRDIARIIGRTAAQLPVEAVLGIGDGLGIPRTDTTKCQAAQRDGRTWDASFDCTAPEFLRTAPEFLRTAAQLPVEAVLGIGDVLGIPRTDTTKCQAAQRDRRTWDASFDCTAPEFLRYMFSSNPPPSQSTHFGTSHNDGVNDWELGGGREQNAVEEYDQSHTFDQNGNPIIWGA